MMVRMTEWMMLFVVVLGLLFLVAAQAEAGNLCEYSLQQEMLAQYEYDVAKAENMWAYEGYKRYKDDKTSDGYKNWRPYVLEKGELSTTAHHQLEIATNVRIENCSN
jgi:hypothetical protein